MIHKDRVSLFFFERGWSGGRAGEKGNENPVI